jgi:hypothetical protein
MFAKDIKPSSVTKWIQHILSLTLIPDSTRDIHQLGYIQLISMSFCFPFAFHFPTVTVLDTMFFIANPITYAATSPPN